MADEIIPSTPVNSVLSQESRDFDYEAFYHDHLVMCEDFAHQSFSLADMQVTEFGSNSGDGSQVYAMTSLGRLPVMKVSGDVVTANITPSLAQRNRVPDRPVRMDRYLLRLMMSSRDYQQVLQNSNKIVEFWKQDKDKLFDISIAGKHHATRDQFDKEGIDVLFHGLTTPNEFVFTKSVGIARTIDSTHPLYLLLPSTEEQSLMKKPSPFHWNTKIPVFNEQYRAIHLVETPVRDKSAEVYFQISQLFYGGKVRLQPEIVGVQVSMSEVLESPQKKARKSALF